MIKEVGIDLLYKEFKALENYHEKLKFFDQHFTLLPFDFPTFDLHLHFLVKENGLSILTDLLEKERRKSYSFIKRVYHNETEFVFDVNARNSNMCIFNDYVISKFIYCNAHLLENDAQDNQSTNTENAVLEANSLIENIKQNIDNKQDRTFRKQFFSVFYSGYLDYTNAQIKKYAYKKKFIELYLYSMGILFGKYKASLLEQLYTAETKMPEISTNSISYTLFKAKVLLLNELGVTKFLRDRYKDSGELNIENKIAELYCTITGENVGMAKNIVNYIH